MIHSTQTESIGSHSLASTPLVCLTTILSAKRTISLRRSEYPKHIYHFGKTNEQTTVAFSIYWLQYKQMNVLRRAALAGWLLARPRPGTYLLHSRCHCGFRVARALPLSFWFVYYLLFTNCTSASSSVQLEDTRTRYSEIVEHTVRKQLFFSLFIRTPTIENGVVDVQI